MASLGGRAARLRDSLRHRWLKLLGGLRCVFLGFVCCCVRLRDAMQPHNLHRAIRRRAEQVRVLGTYIGFFEWCCWSALKSVAVHMLFGTTVIDIRSVFGPPVVGKHRRTHRVAAVRVAGGHGYHSAVAPGGRGHVPVCNHFLIGVAPQTVADIAGAAATGPHKVSTCALRAAMRAGWILKHTAKQGDCGIDVMCYHAGLVRVPSSWQAVRNELADFMLAVQGENEWQECFAACQDFRGSHPIAWPSWASLKY